MLGGTQTSISLDKHQPLEYRLVSSFFTLQLRKNFYRLACRLVFYISLFYLQDLVALCWPCCFSWYYRFYLSPPTYCDLILGSKKSINETLIRITNLHITNSSTISLLRYRSFVKTLDLSSSIVHLILGPCFQPRATLFPTIVFPKALAYQWTP